MSTRQRLLSQPPNPWTTPPEGWVKANTDGAVELSTRMAAIGGEVRDHNDNWLFGFSRDIGSCSIPIAEL
ncbi:hypothetical protein GQ457_05G014250 [Hibiscus cannabinus]